MTKQDWSESDIKLFRNFAKDAGAHQIGNRRLEKYRTDLTIARSMSGMGMLEMVESVAHLKKACTKINSDTQYSFETKRDAKRTLGSLFCFHNYKDRSLKAATREVRELVKHEAKGKDKRLARPVITRGEMRELSKHAGSNMDRALIWTLFETGMRNGEFEQMKKSDLTEIDEGFIVKVPAGKTGERETLVVEGAAFVKAWLVEHPVKSADAPLWYYVRHGWDKKGTQKENREGTLTQAGIARRLRCIVARLNDYRKKHGIPAFAKDTNPHNFRHSRASEMGGQAGMTEQIMDKYFGWEIGSAMPRVYIHLTDKQVRNAVLRNYGKAKPADEKEVVSSWTCSRCKKENTMELNYCGTCGASQDGKVLNLTEKLRMELADMQTKQTAMKKDMEELQAKLLIEKTASHIQTKRMKSGA